MPRVSTPKHRIHRAFAPLIFRAHFQPERLMSPPPLPWNMSYPPHGDGKPADDPPLVAGDASFANNAPLVKIKRPPGEPGRRGDRGFTTKDVLNLPEGIFEELLGEVHSLAAARLNLALSISHQPVAELNLVYKEIREKYPILEKFEADWPAKAILQVFLKNTSSKHTVLKSK